MSDFYCEQVLSGKIAVRLVKDTPRVLAFHHTRPSYPVHIVVIPKLHIASLLDIGPGNEDVLIEMLGVIREIAAQVLADYGACRVLTNLGAYQESKHLHWHIVSGERLAASV